MKNKIYGYVRISTKKQSIERQVRNIKERYPNAIIVKEIYTGTKLEERKEFNKLLSKIKKGDVIVFDSVSRMSRNAESGVILYEELFNKGVNLVFLKEPHINTETYNQALNIEIPATSNEIADLYIETTKKALMILARNQIKLAFDQAEKEVKDLQQRTKEGIETARLNGKQIGLEKGTKLTTKKSIIAKEVIIKYSKAFDGNMKDIEVMELLRGKLGTLNKETYYKYKKELKLERENA